MSWRNSMGRTATCAARPRPRSNAISRPGASTQGRAPRPARSVDQASAAFALLLLGGTLGSAEDRFADVIGAWHMGSAVGGQEEIFEDHHPARGLTAIVAVAVDCGVVRVRSVLQEQAI